MAAYRTRTEWALAEWILGVVSCSTAITGIAGGIVSEALRDTASNMPWFLSFYVTGSIMIVIAAMDSMCRRHACSLRVTRAYAHLRMIVHCANSLCWLSAFLWLTFTETFVASILYESLPLMAFNAWGATEHAKAIWLKPRQAGTTSLAGALLRRLSRG